MKKQIAVEIISFMLIALFTYAAISKILDYQRFRVQVGQSPLLTAFGGVISTAVPAGELIIAVLLAFPRPKLFALYASFSLMVLFSSYIVYILNFSLYVPCACGGLLQSLSWKQHLWCNLVFTTLSVIAVLLHPQQTQTMAQSGPC